MAKNCCDWKRCFAAGLVAIAASSGASPAFGQTHLTFAVGDGASQTDFGGSSAYQSRAGGVDFRVGEHWWMGVETGVVIATGRGSSADDNLLLVPVNLYRYFQPAARLRPFVTFGYTSVMVVGVGCDVGVGLDVVVFRTLAVRVEGRGFLVGGKAEVGRLGLWRIGAVVELGRR